MNKKIKYFIATFGCQANIADSERVAAMLEGRGMVRAKMIDEAKHIIINTCMIRQSAEDRVYGLVNNLTKRKLKEKDLKIVVTGCMVGIAIRDKTQKFFNRIRERMPQVDEFLPIEEVGFDNMPIRTSNVHAWVPVSNGCNNFCTFCVVPFTRGREISRGYKEIIDECRHLAENKFTQVTLIGQNVNSYGSDIILGKDNIQVLRDINNLRFFKADKKDLQHYILPTGRKIKPVYVKHLGRLRIPTLFPFLLDDICKIKGIQQVDFISSNPWDFSDALIDTIARNPKISRKLHLAVQSGDNNILKKMNRWYTKEEFLLLIDKIKKKIPNVYISTDIIVGFCGETDGQFKNTVDLVNKAGFTKAYISMYSDRPQTTAHKLFIDDIPYQVKRKRWQILENLINQPNLGKTKFKWLYQ